MTVILQDAATSSAPIFTELLPWGLMGTGIIIGCMLIGGIIGWFIHGFSFLTYTRNYENKYRGDDKYN